MKQLDRAEISASTLYIVPTPIGNLGDITQRALTVLSGVDLVAAEDTRHTGLLLQHFAIAARLFALHDHNEQQKAELLLAKLLTRVCPPPVFFACCVSVQHVNS